MSLVYSFKDLDKKDSGREQSGNTVLGLVREFDDETWPRITQGSSYQHLPAASPADVSGQGALNDILQTWPRITQAVVK